MSPHKGKPPKHAANDLTILLRTVLGDDRFPVDVEALTREVSRNNEDPIETIRGTGISGFEGMLRAKKTRPGWDILYSTQARHLGRQRFTLAHEFGHYILHRRQLTADDYRYGKLGENLDFQCLPLQADQWKFVEKQREHEADIFASYLLMPMDDYRKQVAGQDMTLDLLDHVTNRYGVSLYGAVPALPPTRQESLFGRAWRFLKDQWQPRHPLLETQYPIILSFILPVFGPSAADPKARGN